MPVRQGAFLDDDALALVAKAAEDEGLQIRRARRQGRCPGVVIEDGEIVASAEAAE